MEHCRGHSSGRRIGYLPKIFSGTVPVQQPKVIHAIQPEPTGQQHSLNSQEMRDQLNGLAEMIANIPVGPQGPEGPQGPPGDQGADGAPGEVTFSQLDTAIDLLRQDSVQEIEPLNFSISNPPTQAQVSQIYAKLNELIVALKRA